MEGEHHTTEVVDFARKKDRLSQVVDKLAGIGNASVFTDKENNNITDSQLTESLASDSVKHLYSVTSQLAPSPPQVQQPSPHTTGIVPPLLPYIHKIPTTIEEGTYVPQIASTVPEVLPVNGDQYSTILQKFFLYGGQNPSPSTVMPLEVWQYFFNAKYSSNYMKTLPNEMGAVWSNMVTPDVIKKEPEDKNETIETWSKKDSLYDQKPSNYFPVPNLDIGKMNNTVTYISAVQSANNSSFPSQPMYHLSPQFASAVPHTHQAEQQPAATTRKSHIPIPTIPTQLSSESSSHHGQKKHCVYNQLASCSDTPYSLALVKSDVDMMKVETIQSTDTESEMSWKGSNPSPKVPIVIEIDPSQDFPLDLSMKGAVEKKDMKMRNKLTKITKRISPEMKRFSFELQMKYPEVRGDVASPTTRETMAARYNMEVSPVVEQMPDGADTAWACPMCGQLFSQKDRLAKHVACRHRGHSPSRTHICLSCNRGFSRSDMLTRHLRLHTGQKPYRCTVCGQIFSRSDHLATHRRTHTGEKPYKCPQCSYSACRRDMITRHMRTHRTATSPISNGSPPAPGQTL